MVQKRPGVKLVIFDFDGTLAATKGLYWHDLLDVLKKEGISFKKSYLKGLFGMRAGKILKEIGIKPKSKFNRMLNGIHARALRNSHRLRACPGLNSIRKIKERKVIVTNSLKAFVLPFIKKHNLLFDEIIGGNSQKEKEQIFRELFRRYKIKPREAVYVGDKAKDAEIAHAAGCVSAIVNNHYSWDSLEEVKRAKPDFIIRNLKELKKSISS